MHRLACALMVVLSVSGAAQPLSQLKRLGLSPTEEVAGYGWRGDGYTIRVREGRLSEIKVQKPPKGWNRLTPHRVMELLGMGENAHPSKDHLANTEVYVFTSGDRPVGTSYCAVFELREGSIVRVVLPNGWINPAAKDIGERAALEKFKQQAAKTYGSAPIAFKGSGLYYSALGGTFGRVDKTLVYSGERVLAYGFVGIYGPNQQRIYGSVRASDGEVLGGGYILPDFPDGSPHRWRDIDVESKSNLPWAGVAFVGLAVLSGAAWVAAKKLKAARS